MQSNTARAERDTALRAAEIAKREALAKAEAEAKAAADKAQAEYLKNARLAQLKTDPLGGLRFAGNQIVAFKCVDSQLRSFHTDSITHAKTQYALGAIAVEARFDTNEDDDCSSGLNVATLPWIFDNFRSRIDSGQARVLRVIHSADDLVAIPFATQGKYRVKKLFVEADITQDLIDAGLFAGETTAQKQAKLKPQTIETGEVIRVAAAFKVGGFARCTKVFKCSWFGERLTLGKLYAIAGVDSRTGEISTTNCDHSKNTVYWGELTNKHFEPVEVVTVAAPSFQFDGQYKAGDIVNVDNSCYFTDGKEYTVKEGLDDDAQLLIAKDDDGDESYVDVQKVRFVRRPSAQAAAKAPANDNAPTADPLKGRSKSGPFRKGDLVRSVEDHNGILRGSSHVVIADQNPKLKQMCVFIDNRVGRYNGFDQRRFELVKAV